MKGLGKIIRQGILIHGSVTNRILNWQSIELESSRWKLRKHRSFAVGGLCVALLLPQVSRAETNLTFCYDPYPPYTFGSEGAPQGGLKVNLLKTIVDQIDGVTANVVLLPWKRCHAQVKAGEIDGILPLFKNTERETYLIFTDATFEETSKFWYSRERFPDGLDWSGGFENLAHLRLGMLNGSFINSDMEAEFSETAEITRARDVSSLLKLLVKGRVDLIATADAVGRYNIHQDGLENKISMIERPISRKSSHFGLSRSTGASAYLDAFNRVIRRLKADGAIEEILQSTDYPK